jgi:hypothetical protein
MPASACDPATTIHPFHPSIHDVPCRHPSHLSLRQSSSSARQRSMQCGTAAGASRQLTVPCMRIRAFRPAPPWVSSWIRLPSPWVSSCIRLPSPPQARTPHIPIPAEPVNQSSRATAEWASGDLPPPLVRSFGSNPAKVIPGPSLVRRDGRTSGPRTRLRHAACVSTV